MPLWPRRSSCRSLRVCREGLTRCLDLRPLDCPEGSARGWLWRGRSLRHPAILILDESTSALDLPTEQAIFRSIEALRAHQTTVLISHRLRSLTWVDRIILLDEGRIVAQGTHSALYREEPLYRRLYEQDCPDQEAKERPYTQRGVVVELRESL